MGGDDLRAQVEAFVRQDLQPFFDSLKERAALSDEKYWQRMQAGMKDSPEMPAEIAAMLGPFMDKEAVLARRHDHDHGMLGASETLVDTKVKRCLPFAEAIHGDSDGPLTREEFETASLQAGRADLERIRDNLKLRADAAGDDPRGLAIKRLSESAEIDVASILALGDTRPMTDETVREVAEEIAARLQRLGEDLRAGRLKKPDEPS